MCNPITASQESYEIGILIPILQVRKGKPIAVRQHIPGQMASDWPGRDGSPVWLDSRVHAFASARGCGNLERSGRADMTFLPLQTGPWSLRCLLRPSLSGRRSPYTYWRLRVNGSSQRLAAETWTCSLLRKMKRSCWRNECPRRSPGPWKWKLLFPHSHLQLLHRWRQQSHFQARSWPQRS